MRRTTGIAAAILIALCASTACAAGDERNIIRLRESDVAPGVDGRLVHRDYDQGMRLERSMLQWRSFRPLASPPASTYVVWRGDRLYFCWISPLRPGEYPRSATFVADSSRIATDSSVELYLTPPVPAGEQVTVYQFVGNVRGAYFDAMVQPAIGQAFPGWNGHFRFANTAVPGKTWVSELSLPLEDVGVSPAEAKKGGVEIGLEMARDGGFAPQSYSLAFARYTMHTRLILDADAPVVQIRSFGNFGAKRFDPLMTVSSPDRPAKVTLELAVLSEKPDPKTGQRTVLAEKKAQADVPAGGSAQLKERISLRDIDSGYARLRLSEADGKVLLLRTWPFQSSEPNIQPVAGGGEPRRFALSAFWAPTMGRVHVLADVFGLNLPADANAAVDIEAVGPDGKVLGRRRITEFAFGGGMADLDLGGPMKPGSYVLRAVAKQGDANELARAEVQYHRTVQPWEGNPAGREQKVIYPWTPLKAKGDTVEVWGRTMRLGDLALPAAVSSLQQEPTRGSARRELLAGPVRLRITSEGKELPLKASPCELVSASDAIAQYKAAAVAGSVECSVVGRAEYDGFYRVDLTVRPTSPTPLDGVTVEVPLVSEVARLLFSVGESKRRNHTSMELPARDGVLWDSKSAARNEIVTGNFLPYVWIGDEDRGLAWMADSDRTWVLDFEKPCLDVVRRGGQTVLRIHLLNHPGVLDRLIQASFSLQATPIRPRMPGGSWRKAANFSWAFFGDGSGRFGPDGAFPLPGEQQRLIDSAKAMVDGGTRVFPYQNMISGDIRQQAYHDFQGEWMVLPGHGNKTQAESFTDWSLDCFRWWVEKCHATGLYFDCVFPVPNMNTLAGIGWIDEQGRRRAGYDMFADREFFKRIATWLRSRPECRGQEIVLYMHMTDMATVSSLGWSGYWLDGENYGLVRRKVDDPDAVDRWGHPIGLASIRTSALGRQYGMAPGWCTGYEEFGTVFGLHDIPHRLAVEPYRHELGGTVRNTLDMTSERLQFIPYWHVHKWYQASEPNVLASAWRLGEKVRVQVSNLEHRPVDVGLKLDLAFLGLSADCTIARETDGREIAHVGGHVPHLPIGYHQYEVLMLAPKGTLDTSARGADIAALNTGKGIAEFREDFETLDANVWTASAGSPVGLHRKVKPYYGTLRIEGVWGEFANVHRKFGRDGVSVRIKVIRPDGRSVGPVPQTHPMAALYWGKGRYLKGVLTNVRRSGAPERIVFSAAGAAGKDALFQGPELAWANWLRFDLNPKAIDLLASADGKTWQAVGSVPRGEAFAGPPTHLVLGSGDERADSPHGLLCNDNKDFRPAPVYFDEIVVEETGR